MTVTPRNYCAKAIEDLKELAANRSADAEMRLFAAMIVNGLQSAVKFHLPENGLINDNYRVMPERFRLPFPITAIEYWISRDSDPSEVPILFREEGKLVDARERVALAIEVLPDAYASHSSLVPVDKAAERFPDGYIAIIPVFYLRNLGRWAFPIVCLAVSMRRLTGTPPKSPIATEIYGIGGGLTLPFAFEAFAASKAIVREEIARGKIDELRASIFHDNGDEVRAILDLIQILSCANVKTSDVDPPAKLNKARVKAGKQPFFSYKVLELAGGADGEAGAGGGTHASPRVHLRRGHIRRLPSKNIWVNAAVVGNPKRGMVQKDYAVKVA